MEIRKKWARLSTGRRVFVTAIAAGWVVILAVLVRNHFDSPPVDPDGPPTAQKEEKR